MQLLQCSNKKLSVTFSSNSKKEISKTVPKTGGICPDKGVQRKQEREKEKHKESKLGEDKLE